MPAALRCAGGGRASKSAPTVTKAANQASPFALASGADCDVAVAVAAAAATAETKTETAVVLESMDVVNSTAASAEREENKIEITASAAIAEAEAEAEVATAAVLNLAAASADREENKIEVATHAPGRQRLPMAVSVEAAAHCDVPNIASFTVADVFTWLVDRVGISLASATKLRDQEMSGRALLRVTEDRLTQAPFCLPAGAASNIAEALETWRH
jgi:hypothetical protein